MKTVFPYISLTGVVASALVLAPAARSGEQPVPEGIALSEANRAATPAVSTVIGKDDYRAPSDGNEPVRLSGQEPETPLPVSAKPLVGTWLNADRETGGLASVIIAPKGEGVTIHVLGACAPNPCNWGVVNGTIYAQNVDSVPAVAFTARYTLSFEQVILVGHLVKGSLQIESFSHFTDGSHRADYYELDVMIK